MKVIALEEGYDNIAIRHPGEIFDMPDDVFEPRPRLKEDGEPIKDSYYDPPHWFEPVDASDKAKVESQRGAIRKRTGVTPIDPARQQADQSAEGRLRAAAQEIVRAEQQTADEAETNKRVEAKLAELRKSSGLKAPANETAVPFKGSPVPSPDNLERSNAPRAATTPAAPAAPVSPQKK